MAIDMKTATGGGVTLFVLSGSSSYLIANSVGDGEDATQKTSSGVVSPKTKNESTSIGSEVFHISTIQSNKNTTPTEADSGVSTQTETPQETEEEIEIEANCTEAFGKPVDDTNYKKEIKEHCTNLTLEARAKQLNIALLKTTGKGSKETLKARFDSLKSKNPSGMATDSAARIDWYPSNTDEANVKAFCESVKKLNLEQFNYAWNQEIEKEWSNFLLMCAKEANLNKDFWTGE